VAESLSPLVDSGSPSWTFRLLAAKAAIGQECALGSCTRSPQDPVAVREPAEPTNDVAVMRCPLQRLRIAGSILVALGQIDRSVLSCQILRMLERQVQERLQIRGDFQIVSALDALRRDLLRRAIVGKSQR
jgi:hypothetical protein